MPTSTNQQTLNLLPNPKIMDMITKYESADSKSVIAAYINKQAKLQQPVKINDEDELIIHIKQEAQKILNITNQFIAANSSKARPKTDISNAELVYLMLMYIPIINIRVSDSSTELGVFQYFGDDRGRYLTGIDNIKRIIYRLSPIQTAASIKTVIELLIAHAPVKDTNKDKNLIIVGNGIYNKKQKTLMDFNPEVVSLSKIETKYNRMATLEVIHNDKDGTDWDVENWLKDLAGQNHNDFDPDTYKLFWQIIAASIQPGVVNNKAIFFYSDKGNNGKGTYGQLLKNIVGRSNYSSLPINAFKHEYHKERLIGKSLNIADENPVDQYVDDVMDFKASITGDDILINRKHEKPISMQIKQVNIQMLNGLPKTKDKSQSFYRRILLVPFVVSFTNNGERPYIKTDYINRDSVKEYVLKTALEMEPFTEYTVPARSTQAMNKYIEYNDSVVEFWNYAQSRFQWDLLPFKFLYETYIGWYTYVTSNAQHVNYSTFRQHLINLLENNENYVIREKGTAFNVGKLMDADEPLITKYNVKSYMADNYTGSDPKARRQFKRPKTAHGILFVGSKDIDDDSDTIDKEEKENNN